MIVETTIFSLVDAGAQDGFLALNERYQEAVAYQTPGMLRRTVARGENGDWIEILLWADDANRVMQGDGSVLAEWNTAVLEVSRGSWRGL